MSFPAYQAYKDSGVEWLGEVPQHWSLCRMAHLEQSGDDFVSGPFGSSLGSADYIEEGIPVIRGVNTTLRAERRFIEQGFVFVSEQKYLDLRRCNAEPGDIVFTARGTVGKVALVPCSVPISLISPNQLRFRPRSRKMVADYFFYMFSSENLLTEVFLLAESVAQPNMNLGSLKSIKIMLPSPPEQTQIARFLDHETARIDALIDEQQRLIELLKEKRQALISHAVTKGLDPTVPMKDSGVEWLGAVPAHWNVIRLGQNIRTRKGFAFSAADFSDEGAAVVKASDIKNHSINEPSTFIGFEFLKKTPNAILRKGNLVLSTVGSTPDVKNSAVGQIGCVPEHLDGALLNQNTVIFEPADSRVSSEYLFFTLLTTAYRDHLDLNAHGTANQASLSLSDMLSFCIPLPDLDEQKAISSELSRVLENVKALERESESLVGLLTERRSALISAAVTGKIDVRGWQSPASAPTPELVEEVV